MSQKRYNQTYNDGVVSILADKTALTSFGAAVNPIGSNDLGLVTSLCYQLMSCRQQDQAWAEQRQVTLDLKISTPLCGLVQEGMSAQVGHILYYISKLDVDRQNQIMYLYLSEVRNLAE